jgi:hypothetical protein
MFSVEFQTEPPKKRRLTGPETLGGFASQMYIARDILRRAAMRPSLRIPVIVNGQSVRS